MNQRFLPTPGDRIGAALLKEVLEVNQDTLEFLGERDGITVQISISRSSLHPVSEALERARAQLLKAPPARNPLLVDAALRERTHHRAIPALIQHGVVQSLPYLIAHPVHLLPNLAAKPPKGWKPCLEILEVIWSALSTLHQQRITLNDLSPERLRLTSTKELGAPCLIQSFRAARLPDQRTWDPRESHRTCFPENKDLQDYARLIQHLLTPLNPKQSKAAKQRKALLDAAGACLAIRTPETQDPLERALKESVEGAKLPWTAAPPAPPAPQEGLPSGAAEAEIALGARLDEDATQALREHWSEIGALNSGSPCPGLLYQLGKAWLARRAYPKSRLITLRSLRTSRDASRLLAETKVLTSEELAQKEEANEICAHRAWAFREQGDLALAKRFSKLAAHGPGESPYILAERLRVTPEKVSPEECFTASEVIAEGWPELARACADTERWDLALALCRQAFDASRPDLSLVLGELLGPLAATLRKGWEGQRTWETLRAALKATLEASFIAALTPLELTGLNNLPRSAAPWLELVEQIATGFFAGTQQDSRMRHLGALASTLLKNPEGLKIWAETQGQIQEDQARWNLKAGRGLAALTQQPLLSEPQPDPLRLCLLVDNHKQLPKAARKRLTLSACLLTLNARHLLERSWLNLASEAFKKGDIDLQLEHVILLLVQRRDREARRLLARLLRTPGPRNQRLISISNALLGDLRASHHPLVDSPQSRLQRFGERQGGPKRRAASVCRRWLTERIAEARADQRDAHLLSLIIVLSLWLRGSLSIGERDQWSLVEPLSHLWPPLTRVATNELSSLLLSQPELDADHLIVPMVTHLGQQELLPYLKGDTPISQVFTQAHALFRKWRRKHKLPDNALDDFSPKALTAIGKILLDMGKVKLARLILLEAAQRQHDGSAYRLLAKTDLSKGEIEQAAQWISCAIMKEPDSIEAKLTLAKLLQNQQRWDEVLPLAKLALKRLPNDSSAWTLTFEAARHTQKQIAPDLLIEALSRHGHQPTLRNAIVELLEAQGHVRPLITLLEDLATSLQLSPDEWGTLAKHYQKLDRDGDAFHAFVLAKRDQPNENQWRNAIQEMLLGAGFPSEACAAFL